MNDVEFLVVFCIKKGIQDIKKYWYKKCTLFYLHLFRIDFLFTNRTHFFTTFSIIFNKKCVRLFNYFCLKGSGVLKNQYLISHYFTLLYYMLRWNLYSIFLRSYLTGPSLVKLRIWKNIHFSI